MPNKTFSEVWDEPTDLYSEYITEFPSTGLLKVPDSFNWQIFYYLCVGRWGNTEIIVPDSSLPRWKARFFSTVFQFGPNWAKQLEIQAKLRDLTEEDLMKGGLMVSTNALNPAEKPSETFDGLDVPKVETIQQQATSQSRRSKLDAYAALSSLLRTDVTESFLVRFDSLFKSIYNNSWEGGEDGE